MTSYFSFRLLTIVLFSLQPIAYATDPEGWFTFKQAIEKTPFSNVIDLQNRTFDLVINGATNDYEFTVEPRNAFKVDRIGLDKFRVTIINPLALVKNDLIVEYFPIGWQIKRMDPFKPKILGEASCIYNVVFRQSGAGELDLTKFDNDYEVKYELSDPKSVAYIKRAGRGYDITRIANSSTESKIRLSIKKKSSASQLLTDWIVIPACKASQESSPLSSPPLSAPVTLKENAEDGINIQIDNLSFCEDDAGGFCTTFRVKASNQRSSAIQCNSLEFYLKEGEKIVATTSQLIEVLPDRIKTFEVKLKSAYKPSNFKVTYKKIDCFFK